MANGCLVFFNVIGTALADTTLKATARWSEVVEAVVSDRAAEIAVEWFQTSEV